MIELRWRKPAPPLLTQWRGPVGMRATSALAPLEMPLAVLIGPPGTSGAAGPIGPRGLPGDIGLIGPQGATGAQGNVGAQGPQGLQGLQGVQGLQGLAGPPPLSGIVTVTLPPAGGTYEQSQVVGASGVTPSHLIFLTLSPGDDGDENVAEMLDLISLSGVAGIDMITVSITFSAPVSGPITLYWSAQ